MPPSSGIGGTSVQSSAFTNDPMEATWLGFKLWSAAVAAAGTTDPEAVRTALRGAAMPAPSGFAVRIDPADQHLHKPAFIGCMTAEGRLLPVWKSSGLVPPQPWSSWLLSEPAPADCVAPARPSVRAPLGHSNFHGDKLTSPQSGLTGTMTGGDVDAIPESFNRCRPRWPVACGWVCRSRRNSCRPIRSSAA